MWTEKNKGKGGREGVRHCCANIEGPCPASRSTRLYYNTDFTTQDVPVANTLTVSSQDISSTPVSNMISKCRLIRFCING